MPPLRRLRPLLLVLPLLLLAACKVELNRNLSEREANEIVAVLLRAGVPAERGTAAAAAGAGAGAARMSSVLIPESRFADAVEILRSAGLPRQQFSSMGEVFRGEGLVASPTEERARYVWALGQELSRTVSEIDGVLSARVHLVLPENDPLRRETTPSSASVFIRHAPEAAVAGLVPQIKELVANALPGLAYDRVAVTLVPATAPAAREGTMQPAAVEQVFGIWVHSDSAGVLRLLIGGGAVLLLLLLGGLGWLAFRRRAAIPALPGQAALTAAGAPLPLGRPAPQGAIRP
ncbi:type III secretion inner membrane ring lipoprotein SctJ [Pararoseomonas sp. SCSIO 73927]|uniref:type III secretion system inner membrane ring lipoprotein SctJ n=1 Tax=Pararoseomonas sp. SCSIO 73927 TaxID=3114537 RepID=UPI0030D534D0